MADPSSSDQELLRTPLYDVHVASGARMVDFAGWLMPIQYRSILAEHEAVRTSVGVFDLSHMGRLVFRGPDAAELVQWLTVNDVRSLADGQAQYSLFCSQAGGVLDDIVVYARGGEFLMVVNASNRAKLLTWIEQHRTAREFQSQLVDATRDLAMIGVQGPNAEVGLQPLIDVDLREIGYYRSLAGHVDGAQAIIARTGYTGEDGFELIVSSREAPRLWERLSQLDVSPAPVACGLAARDTLRLEAGMPLYGHELDESINPFEAGLGRVVKLDKGEFVGHDALRALKERGPSRKLIGFEMVEPGVPRQGYEVQRGGRAVGSVTSGGFAPTLKRNLGMAYVPPDLAAAGQELQVQVRGRPTQARVVPLPFYQHRTRRGSTRKPDR